MSKKILLSQSAGAKVAIGLATIGGVGAVSHNIISQMASTPTEAETKTNNQSVAELNTISKVLLPTRISSILDAPISPTTVTESNSNNKVELETLNLENSIRTENEVLPFETEVIYNDDKPSNYVNLIQTGTNGSRNTTFVDSFDENGKLIQSVKTFEENDEPKKQIIEIGTKEVEEQNENPTIPTEIITNETNANVELDSKTIIETIPKETVYSIDENLKKDESYTVKGEDGEKIVTTNTVSVNGVEVHKKIVKDEVVTPAIHDVTYISEEEYNKKVTSEDLKEIEVTEQEEKTTEEKTTEEKTTEEKSIEEKVVTKEERNTAPKF